MLTSLLTEITNSYLCYMTNLRDITTVLSGHKNALFRKYAIRSLGIFGSYAQNQQKEESDIDILVEFEKPVGMEFIDLADELEKLLHTKVDLVSKKGIKQKYMDVITKSLIYV